MDPYNNLLDFVELYFPHRLSEYQKKMICTYDQVCVSTFNTVVPQKWPSPKKARCVEQAEKEQEGNIPMNCNTNSERSYLQSRISNIRYGKSFRALFNIDANPYPQTYKDLIDWIKADKFTLDTKKTARIDLAVADGEFFGSVFDGIDFTALPTPDRTGYDKAVKDDLAQYQAALDVIMTSDATAGLKALNDYAAWLPTVAAPTTAS